MASSKNKKVANEELARMVRGGFDGVYKEMRGGFANVYGEMRERFKQVDERLDNMGSHLAMLSRDVGEIRQNFVYPVTSRKF